MSNEHESSSHPIDHAPPLDLESREGILTRLKTLEADNAITVEQIRNLRKKVATLEETKGQIGEMLNRLRALDTNIEAKVDAWTNQANQAIGTILNGLNGAERRINSMWNTLNTVIDWIAEFAEKHGTPREDFENRLVEIGAALYRKAVEHRRAEMQRIKQEQHAGRTPRPMEARRNMAERVLEVIDGMVNGDGAKNDTTKQEG